MLSARQSPYEELNGGDVDPGCGARDRSLEVLCQAAVSIEPCQGPFDNPSAREEMKARRLGGAFDDFDRPVAEFDESLAQIGAVVDAVGKEVAQPRKQVVDGFDDEPGAIAILDVGGVDGDADQQAGSIRG